MIVDRAHYVNGRRVDPATAGGAGFVWLGLVEPTAAELAEVAHEFDLHPLAVEDAVKAHQRPKLEHFDHAWFMVLKTVEYVDGNDDLVLGEILVFVGPDYVVTVRHGGATSVAEVRARLELQPEKLALGPWEILHHLADDVVDEYEVVVRFIEASVDRVQELVLSESRPSHGEVIFRRKRTVLEFRQVVSPLVDALETLAHIEESPVHVEGRVYFRDVQDHTTRVRERLDTLDSVLTSVLQVNVAQIGLRQNEDMRKISAWVAIGVVPTAVAAVYGMNFKHMPELEWTFGYPLVMGVTSLGCVALFRNFKRRGWL
jgi:magnesium transporter